MDKPEPKWTVELLPKIQKILNKKKSKDLPDKIKLKLAALKSDLEQKGYMQPSWPNFGMLSSKNMTYHCHLKDGKPTYVACWQVIDKSIKIIEVYYVGTHENAPY